MGKIGGGVPIIEWTRDMHVGVEVLDEQHKDLVVLIDAAYRTVMGEAAEVGMLSGLDSDENTYTAEGLIRDMKAYALSHFSLEVEYMRRLEYPRAEEHAQMHNEFLHRLAVLERPGTGLDKRVDVFLFLSDWLRTHILREDNDFGDYIRSLPSASNSNK